MEPKLLMFFSLMKLGVCVRGFPLLRNLRHVVLVCQGSHWTGNNKGLCLIFAWGRPSELHWKQSLPILPPKDLLSLVPTWAGRTLRGLKITTKELWTPSLCVCVYFKLAGLHVYICVLHACVCRERGALELWIWTMTFCLSTGCPPPPIPHSPRGADQAKLRLQPFIGHCWIWCILSRCRILSSHSKWNEEGATHRKWKGIGEKFKWLHWKEKCKPKHWDKPQSNTTFRQNGSYNICLSSGTGIIISQWCAHPRMGPMPWVVL